jgi:hypothetical protein
MQCEFLFLLKKQYSKKNFLSFLQYFFSIFNAWCIQAGSILLFCCIPLHFCGKIRSFWYLLPVLCIVLLFAISLLFAFYCSLKYYISLFQFAQDWDFQQKNHDLLSTTLSLYKKKILLMCIYG